ncbi:S24 family peptidase [Devosia sp. J2-20]|uniref:S24 family peptidase n=1 Tax=Devosia sp. J2-20 TaxID=3026161 RepID=UPI002499EA4D|nr:S24 family peptidase [Devosia sp. J2-20]WDQ98168.1 S24 family peptidase [Devosia sp. J2-20]
MSPPNNPIMVEAGSMANRCSDIHYLTQDFVVKIETDSSAAMPYGLGMLSEWLQTALGASGISQAELSRRLTAELGRSIDRAAVNKMTKGTRDIQADELMVIERETGWEAPRTIEVPLKGYVGAGAEVIVLDDGEHDRVSAPRDTRPGTVAVRVRGDSMYPAYESGAVIYYSRHLPPNEMLNKRAVVQLADGRIFLKILRAGSTPTTWTLQSLNPSFSDMEDQVIDWTAPIDWIRPAS